VRRLYRLLFPRRTDPLLDAEPRPFPADEAFARAYEREVTISGTGPGEAAFLAARYREGMRWREVVLRLLEEGGGASGRRRVLDLGAGNSAVELALAACPKLVPVSVDHRWIDEGRRIHRGAGVPFRRVVADAGALPFRPAAFDAALNLETLEHLAEPEAAGRETCRVLRAGAPLVLITPPRWRWALRPDPHFGIRGLVLRTPEGQRRVAARHGYGAAHHYVHRIYSTTRQIARCFPGCRLDRVATRSRAPKRWFWDALVLRRE
jgi:SAM-dependent methyltransferase